MGSSAAAALDSAMAACSVRYPDKMKTDVMNALNTFRDLHPQTDHFDFNGSRRKVVTLNGTIPMIHKGNTYNIPVCIYLLDTHPYHPPVCYVRPTQTMMIKATVHVDTQGRVYLPYLSEWQFGRCDMLGLLQIMVLMFQEQCPVFSRGSSSNLQSASQNTPYPGGGTPYPSQGPGYNMPVPSSTGYNPYSSTPYPASTATGYNPYQQNPPITTQSSIGQSGTIQPEHIKASLISAVEDKVRRRMYNSLSKEHAELQSIRKTRDELNNGHEKLKTMVQRLQSEEGNLQTAVLTYREKIEEMDKILASAPKDEDMSVDNAVETTAPLYRQLVDSYAKDNAIEDGIYYYGQSLKKGTIDLETFLKSVRKLSREQFMLRATMQKCREKAGLPC